MAVNTDLAQSSEPAGSILESLGLQVAPEVKAEPSATQKTKTAKPNLVVVNGQQLPISEVESLVSKAQTADTQIASLQGELKEFQYLADLVGQISEPHLHLVMAFLKDIKQAQDEGRTLVKREEPIRLKLPEGFERVKTEDMMNETATVAEALVNLEARVNQQIAVLAGTLQGLQQTNQKVLAQTQDQLDCAALSKILGQEITLQHMEHWRKIGISDPMKAIPELVKTKGKVQTQDGGAKPPADDDDLPISAPEDYPNNTYDALDPKYRSNPTLVRQLWERGIKPNNPRHAALLDEQMRGQQAAS